MLKGHVGMDCIRLATGSARRIELRAYGAADILSDQGELTANRLRGWRLLEVGTV